MQKALLSKFLKSTPNNTFELKLGAVLLLFLAKFFFENEEHGKNKCLPRIVDTLDDC